MAPLEHISSGVDNTAAESWSRRGSVSTATAIGPLLREAAWIRSQSKIHASITCIPRVENIEAGAASRLTHLPVPVFLKSFNTSFPQLTPWRLSLLPSGVTPRLHTMLLTKHSPKSYPLPDCANTTLRGNNGTPSAHGCASQPTYKESQGPHRRPCSQPQDHPQTKCGAIHPLRGTNLCSRGGPRPKTQYHGIHQFSPGTTLCDLNEIRSSPRKSTPPSCIHPPLHVLNCPRQIA